MDDFDALNELDNLPYREKMQTNAKYEEDNVRLTIEQYIQATKDNEVENSNRNDNNNSNNASNNAN